MLSMGNGAHSQATVLDRVTRLLKLYEKMSGAQQGLMSTTELTKKEQREFHDLMEKEWQEIEYGAERLIADLKEDFLEK